MQSAVERLRQRLAARRFGRPQVEVNPAGDLTVLTVPIEGDPLGEDAIDAVRALRKRPHPRAFGVEVLVAGDTAASIDESDTMTAGCRSSLRSYSGSASCY